MGIPQVILRSLSFMIFIIDLSCFVFHGIIMDFDDPTAMGVEETRKILLENC